MISPVLWQRIEGTIIFLAALYLYNVAGYKIVWFLVLLFSIDVTMLGYLINKKIGATIYNLGHSFTLPLIMLAIASTMSYDLAFAFGLIWLAHTGLDRAFGYGLKFDTDFKDTHLGRIGTKT